jgi:N-acetyl-gamma-glutamyl-phosphate reductase
LLATCSVTLAEGWTLERVRELYAQTYAQEALVTLLDAGETARLREVVRTNGAQISIHPATDEALIIVSALDNLLKGASSQALQNANLMFGYPETLGLV